MKVNTLVAAVFCLLLSCSPSNKRKDNTQKSTDLANSNSIHKVNILSELTLEQESAFEALNAIQINSEVGHIYSTFGGIHHSCFPPDTSFTISHSELLNAMEELLAKYCTAIYLEECTELASKAVLAQEEYLVLQCNNAVNDLITKGTKYASIRKSWILPEVLGQRDVILVW